MIIWLNGTFGAGKTTTARELAGRLDNARHFDPELVGYLLMTALGDHDFKDFQDLPLWRELVPVFTEKIAGFTGQHLIAVQTVLREDYWRELAQGFKRTRWTSSTCSCTSTLTSWPSRSGRTNLSPARASGALTTSVTTRSPGRGWSQQLIS